VDIEKTVVFFGLNPSIANALYDDRTLIRIITFSSRLNYKNIYVINLFGLIAKSPSRKIKNKDPVGDENDLIILKVLEFWRENINVIYGWDGVIMEKYINVIEEF